MRGIILINHVDIAVFVKFQLGNTGVVTPADFAHLFGCKAVCNRQHAANRTAVRHYCDEATSALDPQTTKAILQLLKHLNETLGITVVIITHEMAVVKEICHRVAVMEHGKVVESGEVFNIFANPREDITKSFIHTTSNLRKIEELIAEDSPVVKLNPGELIVRLSYIQRNVSEPLISTVSRKFDIVLNIIFSDIAIVQNAPIGGTVAIISGSRDQITQAIAYLSEKNVGVEVIKDARVSE